MGRARASHRRRGYSPTVRSRSLAPPVCSTPIASWASSEQVASEATQCSTRSCFQVARPIVAFARNDEKLAIAKERGADFTINTRGKSLADIQDELFKLTGARKLDAAIDCVGAEETIQTGIGLLHTSGAFVSVGLVGTKINIPLFPFTAGELTYHGSFWANYSDLQEGYLRSPRKERSNTPSSEFSSRTSTRISNCSARATSLAAPSSSFDVPWDGSAAGAPKS